MKFENIKDWGITIASTIIITIFVIFIFRVLPQYIVFIILMFALSGVFILVVYKWQKEQDMYFYFCGYISGGGRGWNTSSPATPILVNFDEIPNAAKLVEEASLAKDPYIRMAVCEAIDWHFDKIPNAPEILKRLIKDKDPDVRDKATLVLRKYFDRIPNAAKLIENTRIIGDIDDTHIRYTEVLRKYFDKIFKCCKTCRKIGR